MFIIFHRFCLKQPILFIAFLSARISVFYSEKQYFCSYAILSSFFFFILRRRRNSRFTILVEYFLFRYCFQFNSTPWFSPYIFSYIFQNSIYFSSYRHWKYLFIVLTWFGLEITGHSSSLSLFFYYFSVILVFILSEEPGNKNPSPLNVFPFLILPPLSFILSKIWSVASKIGWIKPGQPAVMKRKILKEQVNGYVLNIRWDCVVRGCILFTCITSLCGHKNF